MKNSLMILWGMVCCSERSLLFVYSCRISYPVFEESLQMDLMRGYEMGPFRSTMSLKDTNYA
jgi:hypothetical protein